MNSDWHEKVRKYRGHHCRAAFSLLGYKPHYKSFITPRRVTGIDSVLQGESIGQGAAQTEVPVPETVTIAIPSGVPVESGGQSVVREPAAAERAETGGRGRNLSSPASPGAHPARKSPRSRYCAAVASTSFFKTLPPRHLGTWARPRAPPEVLTSPQLRPRWLLQRLFLPRPRRLRRQPKVLNQVLLQQPRSARVLRLSSLKNRTPT